jgi:copper oxidase (laccase) domain-containing protein
MKINNSLITIYTKLQDTPSGVILPGQIHGDNIVEIVTGTENVLDCDALITKNKTFSLGVRTADCAPICFSDGEKIGIAHVGWRGLCLSLIEKMLSNFNQENLNVFVGPFNHSFEIKKDLCFTEIQEKFGDKYFIEKEGRITFLFKDAIMSLLPVNTKIDLRNTFEDLLLPSFRRDKTSERLVTVISFK